MASRVVRPETQKLEISGGDWLLIKKRLNHGEQDDAFARGYVVDGDRTRVNLLQQTGMKKITAYLLDWSLTDLDEQQIVILKQPVETVEAALRSIDPESFDEILAAINAHEQAMDRAAAAKKKIPSGDGASAAISPSPSAAAGGTSGSAP